MMLTFLGFELDLLLLEVHLQLDNLSALQALISSWLSCKSWTRKELESLVGLLGHTCKVVQPGKAFLHRTFELLAVPKKSSPQHLT